MNPDIVGELDETLHAKARLGIMTVLVSAGASDFKALREQLSLTDGNLGAHIRVLEGTGYVAVTKGFVGRRPRTTVKATPKGRKAFEAYLEQLEAVIRMAGGR